MAEIATIGIVGAGQMGSGIAQVAAEVGFDVLLYDTSSAALEQAIDRIGKRWLYNVQDKATADMPDRVREREIAQRLNPLLGRLHGAHALRVVAQVDFIIEAVVEDALVKKEVFGELDRLAPLHCVFATNTSTILIRELAESVGRKDRFIGMHFMNPPHVLTLLEVVYGPETSDETFATTMEVAQRLGRLPIVEAPDICGFAVNGQVMPAVNNAARLLSRMLKRGMSWECACEVVDGTYEVCVVTGKPMGVLRLADLIGIDTCVAGLSEMAKEDRYYRPHRLLVRMVKEGHFGRKTKKGFFEYSR